MTISSLHMHFTTGQLQFKIVTIKLRSFGRRSPPGPAASLARSLARSVPCLPNTYGSAVVDGEAEFREGHVALVHGCQVLPGLAVALVARLLELHLLVALLPLLLVDHLFDHGPAVPGQDVVREGAVLGAEVVGGVGEVAADEGEADDEPVLGGELEAHLGVVFEELAVEAEEVGRLDDHLVEVVDLPGVEAGGVEVRGQVVLLLKDGVLAVGEVALEPAPVPPETPEVEQVVGILHVVLVELGVLGPGVGLGPSLRGPW